MTITAVLVGVICGTYAVAVLILMYVGNKQCKEIERKIDDAKTKNETKSKMETGDPRSDFDASIKLLHEYANRQK